MSIRRFAAQRSRSPVRSNLASPTILHPEGTITVSGTVNNATAEGDEPAADFEGPYNTVWYHLNSPVDREIVVTLTSTTNNNPQGIQANLFSGSTLETLVEADDFSYPTVFGLGNTDSINWQLAAGVDYYIRVMGRSEQQGSFDLTYALSSLVAPDGDDFEAPIDSSPSAPVPILTGDTEGATLQPGEPQVTDLVGTVWHKFTPDYDGIYIFDIVGDVEPTNLDYSVWKGTSLSSIIPIPGYYLPTEGGYLNSNPRVLRGGVDYYVRVERYEFYPWESYTLDITSYPEYDDWTSAGAGYDSISGAGGYDSLNDQLTFTGPGSALVDPWLDLDSNPQDAGRRWIEMRFKMRITSGVTMFREDRFNALGVVRALDPEGDPVWELILTGNTVGTNTLAVRDPDDGDTRIMFHPADFGTGERDFNEWVDVEVVLRANTGRNTVPTDYSTGVALNGVKKRYVQTHEIDGVPATIPFRTLEWGPFHYPDSYNTTVSAIGGTYQDPHDDWEIQIKDVVVRNRPTLGMLPSTDTGDLGVVLFDGWEHGDKLDNVDPTFTNGQATIVDAPGTPPGNATWWKSVRMMSAGPPANLTGTIINSWLHNVKPWLGFWLYFEEFPDYDADQYLLLSYLVDNYSVGSVGWAALMMNGEGELRIAPQTSARVWKSYCVGTLEPQTWYWIETEVDTSVMYEATADVSINGTVMGSYQFGSSLADLEELSNFSVHGYTRFPTSNWPMMWWLGPFRKVFGTGSASGFSAGSAFATTVDMHYAHVCMGRAVDFPLDPMQTKLFGGVDEDATHNFPELPVEHLDLTRGVVEQYWTIYDYSEETDTPDPAIAGTAPSEFDWRTPGGGVIDVIADGGGPPEIAADNAIRWAPRGTIPDSPYGTKHYPRFGWGPRSLFLSPQTGLSGDMLVYYMWGRGDGTLSFGNFVSGNDRVPFGTDRTFTGSYQQFWCLVHPPWHPSVVTSTARIESEWIPSIVADRMYWKSARVLGNALSYPRFALSSDAGATWTRLDDPAITTTNAFIGSDVTASGVGIFMNNTSAHNRILETRAGISFPSFEAYGLHSVGYEMTDWYLEYTSVPSVEIEEAEEFGGTRGYNLHLRHAGYRDEPTTARSEGDLYVTLWNGTHRAPHHVVTATTSDISRVRYPTDTTGGHWTTSEFGDTKLRFGYYRSLGGGTTYWIASQRRGALLEAAQWEVLSEAAPGPAAGDCGFMPQIYRLVRYS